MASRRHSLESALYDPVAPPQRRAVLPRVAQHVIRVRHAEISGGACRRSLAAKCREMRPLTADRGRESCCLLEGVLHKLGALPTPWSCLCGGPR